MNNDLGSRISLIAVEMDPSKKYIIMPRERIHAEMVVWLIDKLKEMGISGLVVNAPFDIIPLDQLDRIDINER